MSPAPQNPRIRFAAFEVDLKSQELFRDGAPVRLPNQSFLALAALLERPGELVTREELRARLWPDKRVVEFEQGLNAIINRLREALADSAEDPKYVETLPRRGYRFVGSLQSAAIHPGPTPEPAPARPATDPPSLNPPRFRRRSVAALLIAVIAVIAVGITLAMLRTSPPDTRSLPARSHREAVMPLTSLLGREHMPALSPEGDRVLFSWEQEPGAGFDLYVRPLDSERVTRLTHAPAAAIAGAWSPDGTRVAFARSGGLFLVDATGSGERQLASGTFTQESLMQPSWAPDGRTLAYSVVGPQGWHVIRWIDVTDPGERPLPVMPDCWHAGAPAFSPDALLAFVCTRSIAVYEVYLADLASRTAPPRVLARFRGLPQGLVWRDAQHLLVANDSGDGTGVWTLGLDGQREPPTSFEDSLAPGLTARDGRVVYSRSRQVIDIWHLALRDRSAEARRWIYSTRQQLTPSYSPDGKRIAFQSNRSGSPEIWIADADGSNAARLTSFNGPMAGGPAWCSDGRRLAFDSRESGISAVYIVDTLEGVPRRLLSTQDNLALPAWSADCRFLLASDGREGLFLVPAEGGEARRFTSQRSYQAAVAGERVIFNVAGPDGVQLWSRPLDGGEESPLPGMPRLAYADSWSTDGKGLYFTDTSRQPVTVRRYELATARLETLGALPNVPTPLGGLGLAVSPDGSSLLYTHTEDTQSDLVSLVSSPR